MDYNALKSRSLQLIHDSITGAGLGLSDEVRSIVHNIVDMGIDSGEISTLLSARNAFLQGYNTAALQSVFSVDSYPSWIFNSRMLYATYPESTSEICVSYWNDSHETAMALITRCRENGFAGQSSNAREANPLSIRWMVLRTYEDGETGLKNLRYLVSIRDAIKVMVRDGILTTSRMCNTPTYSNTDPMEAA